MTDLAKTQKREVRRVSENKKCGSPNRIHFRDCNRPSRPDPPKFRENELEKGIRDIPYLCPHKGGSSGCGNKLVSWDENGRGMGFGLKFCADEGFYCAAPEESTSALQRMELDPWTLHRLNWVPPFRFCQ